MAAVLIALAVSYALTRHLADHAARHRRHRAGVRRLTLVLHDELFIKLKPTIIYVLFGGALLGGLRRQAAARYGVRFGLSSDRRRLAQADWRWALFFLRAGGAQRDRLAQQTTDFWVSFKLFGVVPLTFLFGALQYPLLMKYSVDNMRYANYGFRSHLEIDRRWPLWQRHAFGAYGAE